MFTLHKANDEFVCSCTCPVGTRVRMAMQCDRPQCGCGFTFACAACSGTVSFATTRRCAPDVFREHVANDLRDSLGVLDPSDFDTDARVAWYEARMRFLRDAETYVVLDTWLVATDALTVNVYGEYGDHLLLLVPHVEPALRAMLKSDAYWEQAARVKRERTTPWWIKLGRRAIARVRGKEHPFIKEG